MLFDLSNYLFFIIALAVVYIAIVNFIQARVGGKGRLKNLQKEMRDVQLKMIEASKKGDQAASDAAMKDYWKLTGELFTIQMQMTLIIIVIFIGLTAIFPHIEPGMEDDIRVPLYDDGLAGHCDAEAGDAVYSGCLALPAEGKKGAWAADAFLISVNNETLARNATAIYYEGGLPEDTWLQASSQHGIWETLSGKKQYTVNISSDKGNYTGGETVSLSAQASPGVPQGASIYASANAGTFFHYDAPFTIPLINIRRIIGSYGVFLFMAFVVSIAYALVKAAYSKVAKKG